MVKTGKAVEIHNAAAIFNQGKPAAGKELDP